jgi:hypothetical protein
MNDNSAEFELLRATGQVRRPAARALAQAREALWAAVASAMLDIGPAGEQTTTRHHRDRSQNERRMSTGGADPSN